jgi:hypothetical protein
MHLMKTNRHGKVTKTNQLYKKTHRNAHQERTDKISDVSKPSNENPQKRKIKAKTNKCSNRRLRQIRKKRKHPPSLWRELAPHLRNQKLKIRKDFIRFQFLVSFEWRRTNHEVEANTKIRDKTNES